MLRLHSPLPNRPLPKPLPDPIHRREQLRLPLGVVEQVQLTRAGHEVAEAHAHEADGLAAFVAAACTA